MPDKGEVVSHDCPEVCQKGGLPASADNHEVERLHLRRGGTAFGYA